MLIRPWFHRTRMHIKRTFCCVQWISLHINESFFYVTTICINGLHLYKSSRLMTFFLKKSFFSVACIYRFVWVIGFEKSTIVCSTWRFEQQRNDVTVKRIELCQQISFNQMFILFCCSSFLLNWIFVAKRFVSKKKRKRIEAIARIAAFLNNFFSTQNALFYQKKGHFERLRIIKKFFAFD